MQPKHHTEKNNSQKNTKKILQIIIISNAMQCLFFVPGKTTLLMHFYNTLPLIKNDDNTFSLARDDGLSEALLREELSKDRPIILLDQPPDMKTCEHFIDGVCEGVLKRTKLNPDVKTVRTGIIFNWGDYYSTLQHFSDSVVSKCVSVFHDTLEMTEEIRLEMEAADREIMECSEEFSSIFQCYVKEINVKKLTSDKNKANREIRKRLAENHPKVPCSTRVTEAYALNVAGLKAFCRNANLDQDLSTEMEEELLRYFVVMCIPRVMARLNGVHPNCQQQKKKPGKTEDQKIVHDFSDEVSKKISKCTLKETLEVIGFVPGTIHICKSWLKDLGDYEEALEQEVVAFQSDKCRKWFLHKDCEIMYFKRKSQTSQKSKRSDEASEFKYGKGFRKACIIFKNKHVPSKIRHALAEQLKTIGINTSPDDPNYDIGKAVSDHFNELYDGKKPKPLLVDELNDDAKELIRNDITDLIEDEDLTLEDLKLGAEYVRTLIKNSKEQSIDENQNPTFVENPDNIADDAEPANKKAKVGPI